MFKNLQSYFIFKSYILFFKQRPDRFLKKPLLVTLIRGVIIVYIFNFFIAHEIIIISFFHNSASNEIKVP